MPADTLVVLDDPASLDERAEELWEAIRRGFDETRAHYPLISPPEQLWLPEDAWSELCANGIEPVILCDHQGQRDRLFEMLGDSGATLGVGLVSAGFVWRDAGVAVLTDHEIFARYRRRRRRSRRTAG